MVYLPRAAVVRRAPFDTGFALSFDKLRTRLRVQRVVLIGS
jgi:hypothetical protein